MIKQGLKVKYDKTRDVMYVHLGTGDTVNMPWDFDEDVCFDPKKFAIVGYIITNFSRKYPKLADHWKPKEKWFIKDFFAQRLKDWAILLSQFKSKKALLDFLTHEHRPLSPQFTKL